MDLFLVQIEIGKEWMVVREKGTSILAWFTSKGAAEDWIEDQRKNPCIGSKTVFRILRVPLPIEVVKEVHW